MSSRNSLGHGKLMCVGAGGQRAGIGQSQEAMSGDQSDTFALILFPKNSNGVHKLLSRCKKEPRARSYSARIAFGQADENCFGLYDAGCDGKEATDT